MTPSHKPVLFIPDISGFTRFVRSTELSHSQHIISELLELLIDENDLGLTVAEIEGDAILFYKQDQAPSINELIALSKKMYIRFHQHLKTMEALRVCTCGACSTANQLNLKFVLHAGEYSIIQVKEFRKPYGYEVVLAHRLLKNEVPEQEYILFSDSGFPNAEPKELDGLPINQLASDYDQFGSTSYRYISLKDLPIRSVQTNQKKEFERMNDPIRGKITIQQNAFVVHQILLNIGARKLWNRNIKQLLFQTHRVNRIGMPHTCVIGPNRYKFETVASKNTNETSLEFAERLYNPPLRIVKEITNYYEVVPNGENQCDVNFETHFKPHQFMKNTLGPFFRKVAQKNVPKVLDLLKSFAENLPPDHPFD